MKTFPQVPVLLVLAVIGWSGCVSSKYRTAPKDSPPATPLKIAGIDPEVAVLIETVIIYRGPGSWKRYAYWDEYVVTVRNHGAGPLTIEEARLTDHFNASTPAGGVPWTLEKESKAAMKTFQARASDIVRLGGGGLLLTTTGFAVGGGIAAARRLNGIIGGGTFRM